MPSTLWGQRSRSGNRPALTSGRAPSPCPCCSPAEGPDGTRLRQLLGQSRPYPEPVVAEVISLVPAAGSVDRVLDEALRRSEMAAEATAALPAGTARSVLTNMGTYLVERVEAVRESAA